MDRFGHFYAWFLVLATGLPALIRLVQARQLALITSERMATVQTRARRRWLGWGSIVFSLALGPVYAWYARQTWLLVALVIGVLTGIEMVGNSRSQQTSSLVRQNRIFGVLYAVSAVSAYLILLRK